MVGHRRTPCMKHGGDADPGAEMFGIGGDGEQGLGRGLEQQVVDHGLVMPGDLSDRRWQGEDDVEVRHGKQLGFPIRQPLARCRALAFWAMPVAAASIENLHVLASIAADHIAAQPRRAAGFDGRHHLELVEADMAGIGGTPCRTVIAEDVRDLQSGLRHGIGPLAGCLALLLRQRRQPIQRARHRADRPGRDLRIDRCRLQFGMPQKHLDHADIDVLLKEMRREAMP